MGDALGDVCDFVSSAAVGGGRYYSLRSLLALSYRVYFVLLDAGEFSVGAVQANRLVGAVPEES